MTRVKFETNLFFKYFGLIVTLSYSTYHLQLFMFILYFATNHTAYSFFYKNYWSKKYVCRLLIHQDWNPQEFKRHSHRSLRNISHYKKMSGIQTLENNRKNIIDEEDDVFFKLEYLARNEINGVKNTTTFGCNLRTTQNVKCTKRYDDYLANIFSQLEQKSGTENDFMDDLFLKNFDTESLIFISNEKQTIHNGYTVTDDEKPQNPFNKLSSTKRKDPNQYKGSVHKEYNDTKNGEKSVSKAKPRSSGQVLWRRGKAGSSTDDSDTSTNTSVNGLSRCTSDKQKTLFGCSEMITENADENVHQNKDTGEFTGGCVLPRILTFKTVSEISSSMKKTLYNCTSCKMPIVPNKLEQSACTELPEKCVEDSRPQSVEERSSNTWSHLSEKKKSKNQKCLHYRQLSDTKLSDKRQTKKCAKCFLCCGKGVFPLSESIRAGLTYSVNPYPRVHCATALEPCDACASHGDEDKDSSTTNKKDYSRMTKVERKKELQRIYGMRLSEQQGNVNQINLRRPEWVF